MRLRDELKEAAVREKALQMIVDEGFDGLSMQRLAKAANVSPATIYIYFKDREDLIVQLYLEETRKMSEATLAGFHADMDFEEGLRVQWMNRAKYFLENPLSMNFIEQVKYSPYADICLSKMDKNFTKVLGEFAHNAIKRKQLVKLPLEVYWSIAFAPLYQLVKMHMLGRGIPATTPFTLDDKVMNQTLKLVIKALTPPSVKNA
jgi:TetR/AcrR family transcriptional regulator, multidrug resistance operon repressor